MVCKIVHDYGLSPVNKFGFREISLRSDLNIKGKQRRQEEDKNLVYQWENNEKTHFILSSLHTFPITSTFYIDLHH